MLPNSRSQTPQQNQYPGGFPSNNAPPPQTQQQHANQQPPYPHLQNGSTNASPSPIMSNQLRPGGVPQRVSTASPHPFSPAGQQFSQASPSQSEHGSRVDTPQGSNPYTQNPGFAQGFNQQNFTPPPGRTSAPPQNPMSTPQPNLQQMYAQQQAQQQQQRATPQSMDQQKLLYQMRMQQQRQQQNLMAGQMGNMPPNANAMAKIMTGQNGQFPGLRPQQAAAAAPPRGGMNAESFQKSLSSFMQQKNLPLDMNPAIGDRSIGIMALYLTVVKFGGYKKVTTQNGWNQVAASLQFHPIQHPTAAGILKAHYERNLLMFEEAWQASQQQQRQRAAMMQQNSNSGGQMSPTKQMNPQAMQQSQFMQQQQALMNQQQQHLQQQHMQATPVKQMHAQQPPVNGFSTPQAGQPHPMAPQNHTRNSLSRTLDATPPQNGSSFTMPSPASASKPGSLSLQSPHLDGIRVNDVPTPFNLPDEFFPKTRELDTFGGVDLGSLYNLGSELIRWKPDVPVANDLGLIDIDAITRSLQCGLHAEVRLALDTMITLSVHGQLNLDLRACEDLMESLVDCAEDQVELLAENAAEVSDVMLVSSYEDVLRGSRLDQDFLQETPVFGTLEYELDRAVDKLICITTIMRNLSFFEPNHGLLADELVVKFLCVVIRYLGTRNMLLRTNVNTLDFMKDVIIILSNLAQAIELPGREQALCLLHFLLAFAPCPVPNTGTDGGITFSPYDPAVHRYLPPAVDSLAKLLARDEPNRTFYKTIFASDVTSSPPFDLLTKTFALAISAIPDGKQEIKRGNQLISVIEARKPNLMQGILAGEILAILAPGFETGVAKSWLTSEDGFAQKLSRLILSLCLETTPQQQRGQAVPRGLEDDGFFHIAEGGISMLRRLGEKSRNPEDPSSTIPFAGLPSKESLLAALKLHTAQPTQPRLQGVLKQLCAYAGLGI